MSVNLKLLPTYIRTPQKRRTRQVTRNRVRREAVTCRAVRWLPSFNTLPVRRWWEQQIAH